jgi:hypothetical protein
MNLATILVCLVLVAIVAAIVGKQLYNRKHRKGGCSCGCEGCAHSSQCHPNKES